MGVLLVFPHDKHLEGYSKYAPPLGLLYIASVLCQGGIDVEIVDCEFEDDYRQTIAGILKRKHISHVGISTMTHMFRASLEVAEVIRQLSKNVKITLGGIHSSYFPDKVLSKYQYIDYVIIGEAEYTFYRLVKGEKVASIDGIAYRSFGEIIINEVCERPCDLDSIPFPARFLVEKYDYKYYSDHFLYNDVFSLFKVKHKKKFAIIHTSRGCPFKCSYCASPAYFNNSFAKRSVENIMSEIRYLIKEGYTNFVFSDDHFTADVKRLQQICLEFIALKQHHDIRWGCQCRTENLSKKEINMMYEAGCQNIFVGVESGSPEILSYYNKKLDREKCREVIKYASKKGIAIVAAVILGAPIETEAHVKETADYLCSLDADIISVSKLMVLPGTEIWNNFVAKGIINIDKQWEDLLFIDDIPGYFGNNEIYRWYKYINKRFYMRPSYWFLQFPKIVKRLYKQLIR